MGLNSIISTEYAIHEERRERRSHPQPTREPGMSNKTKVFLRKEQVFKEIAYTSADKPPVHEIIQEKWQSIIDLVAKIIGVPSGLIMQVTRESMQVFLRSSNPANPYKVGGKDYLGHGLYCETVIGEDSELLVENALESDVWCDNPDVEFKMISYLGLPVKWPDGEFFGTICMLDDKSNTYSEVYRDIMREFRFSIEKDLELIIKEQELKHLAEKDSLTGINNRRMTDEKLHYEFERFRRSGNVFSVCMFDLNRFKHVNDTYGHATGDQVLVEFSKAVEECIRKIDFWGRFGGDEFVLICPATDDLGVQAFLDRNLKTISTRIQAIAPEVSVSYGVCSSRKSDNNYEELLHNADKAMYEMKKHHR